jgi:hypothetical protein
MRAYLQPFYLGSEEHKSAILRLDKLNSWGLSTSLPICAKRSGPVALDCQRTQRSSAAHGQDFMLMATNFRNIIMILQDQNVGHGLADVSKANCPGLRRLQQGAGSCRGSEQSAQSPGQGHPSLWPCTPRSAHALPSRSPPHAEATVLRGRHGLDGVRHLQGAALAR